MQGPIAARIALAPRAELRSWPATVASTTPASAPRQPAWAQPITPAARSAIRTGAQSAHEHAERYARAVGHQRVRLDRLVPPRARSLTTSTRAPCTWRTVQGCPPAGRAGASARARFSLDPRRVVAAREAAVQRGEHALADPALAGEEAVADDCRARRDCWLRSSASQHGGAFRRQRRRGEAWRRRCARPGQRQHLEQLAHGAARRSGGTAPARSWRRCSGVARSSRRGDAQIDPQRAQERSLRHRPVDRGAAA